MSFRVWAPTPADASPSVALEKGIYYRTPTSHKRVSSNIGSPNPYIQRRGQHRNQQNTKLFAVLLILIFACLSSFGMAYYLFKTRWATQAQRMIPALRANKLFLQVNATIFDNYSRAQQLIHPGERFLAYLPHSGFHNQRIAFENALVLARLLNRTLIVPPIRLGNKPIPYYPFDRLSRQLALSDKTGLGHCAHVPRKIAVPPECLDYFDYTYLPWDWLVNLTSVKAEQKLLPRWNFNENWFAESLDITDGQISLFRDKTLYQYRFVDNTLARFDESSLYTRDLELDRLSQLTEKLLFFGTLFGSTRLRLEKETHLAVRKEIREAMTIMHPILDVISESIFRALGGAYLAIHLRAGETKFRSVSEANARTLWWTLLNCFLNGTVEDTMQLEERIQRTGASNTTSAKSTSRLPLPLPSHCTPLSNVERSLLDLAPKPECQSMAPRGTLVFSSPIPPPLYVATDLENPRTQTLLGRFRATFPCIFYLSDFKRQLDPLDHLTNTIDGVPLRPHLLPLVDALVAAKALRVVGTRGSTFSYYVEDILWRTIHKLPIKQRG